MGNKRDLFNHEENFRKWKEDLTPEYIEEGLTKENSKLFIQYLLDMEIGQNVSNKNKRGSRDIKTINRLRSKLRQILKMFQERGVKDISKVKEEQAVLFFSEWKKKGHSSDYAKKFKAFWHWYQKVNRKKGITIPDITEEIDISDKKSLFVWITKEEFEKYRKYFDEEEQLILLFCFDSIIRAPTELLSMKVENVYIKNDEVWIKIPQDITKTIERDFNLIYCADQIKKYIEGKNPDEYLFSFSSAYFNRKMQKIAKQVFGEKKSLGGEYYKNITLYDLRHSGAIHLRQLFAKTGQSLDILRQRGGWVDNDMINNYTRLLGLDGYVEKEKTLLQEDKTKLEESNIKLKKDIEGLKKENLEVKKYYHEAMKGLSELGNKILTIEKLQKKSI